MKWFDSGLGEVSQFGTAAFIAKKTTVRKTDMKFNTKPEGRGSTLHTPKIGKESRRHEQKGKCKLCGEQGHWASACPWHDQVQDFIKKKKEEEISDTVAVTVLDSCGDVCLCAEQRILSTPSQNSIPWMYCSIIKPLSVFSTKNDF